VELRRRSALQRRGRWEGAVLLDRAGRIEAVVDGAGLQNLVSLILADMDPPGWWTATGDNEGGESHGTAQEPADGRTGG